MKLRKDVPEEGELVVIEIEELHEHSATVSIEGYNTTGLVHISEVSRSWVRDIRKELKEGEKSVAQVLEVEDGSINLSLKRVNENRKKEVMEKWRRELKADKFIERVAERTGKETDEIYEEVAFPFQEEFDSTFEGFERVAMGELDLSSLGIEGELAEAVKEVSEENISLKNVEMEGEMHIEVPTPKGIETIREALAVDNGAEVKYVSAPKYSIKVWGRNAEDAKKRMDTAVESIRGRIEDGGGDFSFEKK